MESTLNNLLPPAEICRRNGWQVGTKLIGDEGYGAHTIEITAIGVYSILARCVKPCGDSAEQMWHLDGRDWKLAE
jgi:hypothetical protein